MAWSEAARAAAREARRRNLSATEIERRYRRGVRGVNVNNTEAVDLGEKVEKMENKTDFFGVPKNQKKLIALQERHRIVTKRVSRWRKLREIYRPLRVKGE